LEAIVPEKQTLPSFPTPLKPRFRAIIVGASGGIGAAVSRRLAQKGYTLALVDLNEKALKGLCNEINQKSSETRASYYIHNVTEYNSVPDTLRGIVAELGGIDLFIYIAGVIHFPALDEYNFPEDQKMVEVNLLGAMAWLSQIAPLFKNMKAGQIVGVSSVAGGQSWLQCIQSRIHFIS
jgi:NADP-dependent 3-hydroxy acid dehydrogenase YdfG